MASTAADTTPGSGLRRALGTGFAISAVLGTIIGLGILRTPGEIAAVFPDPLLFTMLWVVGGIFVLMSAGVACELVGMTPRSGGPYMLVRRAFGTYPGFVIGWVDWLSFTANIALKSVVLAEYVALLMPLSTAGRTLLAVVVTTVFAGLQLRGVALGARIQQIAAACMALTVIGFTLALLFSGSEPAAPPPLLSDPDTAAYALVAAAIIFTYDGWLGVSYFGGEIIGGGRAVALACLRAVLMVFVLYVGLMAALAFSVPLSQLAGEELALSAALEMAVSPAASMIVLLAAIMILLAHQNLQYMAGSRVMYALSHDKLGVDRAAVVATRGNPVFAVLLTWGVVVGLIAVGGFEFLLHLSVFFFVILYVVLLAGVVILRSREPAADRPYRAWGHPWTTTFCLLGWTAVSVFQAVSEPDTAVYALAMIAVSLPAYLLFFKRRVM